MLTGAWILALLMSGAPLLALAGGGGEASDDEDEPGEEKQDDSAGVDETLPAPDPEPPEEDPLPTDFEFVLGAGGDHEIAGFRPTVDTLTLTSDTWDFDLYALDDEGEGAALEVALDHSRSVLRFPGLASLPLDDVYLNVAEPGGTPQRIALRDALYPAEEDVLSPTDPDAPDRLLDNSSASPPIAPSDPDEPDVPPEDDGSGQALAPTDPDAPEA